MIRSRRPLFVALIAVQVLVLVGLAAGREITLRADNSVVLQTEPVDPRDLFRGDYVTLAYEISRIDLAFAANSDEYAPGDDVYVELTPGPGGHWGAVSIAHQPAPGWQRFIRGTVTGRNARFLVVEYGIEAYFVPEGQGWEIQWADDVDVVVSLNDRGRAVINYVIVDGTRWEPDR